MPGSPTAEPGRGIVGTGRAEPTSLKEPMEAALGFPRSALRSTSALQSGPGCAHLVVVFVDILVEFVKSHSGPQVTRVVLGERADTR